MSPEKFIIDSRSGFLRWTNWRDFLKDQEIHSITESTKKFAVVLLHYNASERIIGFIEKILAENTGDKLDIIIIENSTKKEESEKFASYTENRKNNTITSLHPITNLGSSGGYSLGMEYCLSNNYEYIFIVEDDILLDDFSVFGKIMGEIDNKTIGFIQAPSNTGGEHSWYVQFACYPREFLENTGVIDPRYFSRSEDLEFQERFNIIQKQYPYIKKVFPISYSHPYLKRGNGQIWWTYLSLRNHLYTTSKWFSWKKSFYLVTIFFYIWYGLCKYLMEGDKNLMRIIFLSIKDYLLGNMDFSYNNSILPKILPLKTRVFVDIITSKIQANELESHTSKLFLLSKQLFSASNRERFSYSSDIIDFFKHGVLIGGILSPLYPISILSPKIFSIDEIELETGEVFISEWQNKNILKAYFASFTSLLLAFIAFVFILPPICVRVLSVKTKY